MGGEGARAAGRAGGYASARWVGCRLQCGGMPGTWWQACRAAVHVYTPLSSQRVGLPHHMPWLTHSADERRCTCVPLGVGCAQEARFAQLEDTLRAREEKREAYMVHRLETTAADRLALLARTRAGAAQRQEHLAATAAHAARLGSGGGSGGVSVVRVPLLFCIVSFLVEVDTWR